MSQGPDNGSVIGAPPARGQWQSRLGFVLAASGSAVGLGNIWKFPYVTGANGGGWFVLIYLICIATVGLPVMIAEIMVGRASQRSAVPAYERLSGGKTVWSLVGWMGVLTGFILLSYYSIVAGWSLEYIRLALTDSFRGSSADEISSLFGALYGDFGRNLMWHAVFMTVVIAVVIGGVQKGIERVSTVLMPTLLLMMIGLVIYSATLDGFGPGMEFIFAPNAEHLTPGGVLEALGQSFFSLSLGMGALITYGSYLKRDDDVVKSSAWISGLDSFVALTACMMIFPIVFSVGLSADSDAGLISGPGLVFMSVPVAFSQIPGGLILGVVFFVLLLFAALTSAISLLEVVVATIIDKFGAGRVAATVVLGISIFAFGIPSADSSLMLGDKNFFDSVDFLITNIALPLGGLLVAVFVGWVVPQSVSYEQFQSGGKRDAMYHGWMILIRYFVPVAILLVLLYSAGIIPSDWLR
jgi:neurotransmitter:Na+ symporter, NSS family